MKGLLQLSRVELAITPTPLRAAPQLSEAVGMEIWFKRDDLTGFGLGGNKVRALEYLLGEAIHRGCDCLIIGAGPTSNWAMLATLAARRCGLDAYLVCYGHPVSPAGNLALARLAGAQVTFTGDPDRVSVEAASAALGEELSRSGRKPWVLPRGGATALGACGYVRASLELAEQLLAVNVEPQQLWLATGSGGTQGGLLAAARWLRSPYRVVGVSVSRSATECIQRVSDLATQVQTLLNLPPDNGTDGFASPVIVLGGFLGPGYGIPSTAGSEATRLVARTEGVFLDPVFGAKAMAALLSVCAGNDCDFAGLRNTTGPIVFLVTGGVPTLFTTAGGAP
jgi:D-cysteine desulfhydrase